MKKLIIMLTLVFITFNVKADTTEITAKQIYQDVKDGFISLVNRLDGPAKHTYEVYVREQKVDAWSHFIGSSIFLLFGVCILILCLKKADFVEPNRYGVFSIAGCIFIVAGIGLTIGFICNYGSNLANPEYGAIQQIIKAFSK